MLQEQEDIDEEVILGLFFNLRDDKGWGVGGGKIDERCNLLGSPLTPLVGLTVKLKKTVNA